MKSGTEKNPNPKSVSMGRFRRHVTSSRSAEPAFRDRKAKVPHPLPGSKKRKLKARRSLNKPQNSYQAAVSELRKAAKSGYTGHTIPNRAPMPNRQIAAWSHIWRSVTVPGDGI